MPLPVPLHEDFYRKLRRRIRAWLEGAGASHQHADLILLAPDFFHLIVKLSLDPRVSRRSRTRLALTIAYFISPVDLIPEALFGPAGYVDDVALAALALNALINEGGGEIAREHWQGDGDVLEQIQDILARADQMVGKRVWKKLRDKLT